MILKSRKCLVIIKLFLRAGGAAVWERIKREKGNSREGGSGFGFWQKISRKWENGLPSEIGGV
jgi:hypothetical protein